jgi:hypothetical protein
VCVCVCVLTCNTVCSSPWSLYGLLFWRVSGYNSRHTLLPTSLSEYHSTVQAPYLWAASAISYEVPRVRILQLIITALRWKVAQVLFIVKYHIDREYFCTVAFWRHQCWSQRRVIFSVDTNVSEEHTASIFSPYSAIFRTEDEGSMFFQNADVYQHDHMTLQSRRPTLTKTNHLCEIFVPNKYDLKQKDQKEIQSKCVTKIEFYLIPVLLSSIGIILTDDRSSIRH